MAGNHDYILERIGERNAQLLCKAFNVDGYLHTRNPPTDLHFKSGCKVTVPGPILILCMYTDTKNILEITFNKSQPWCSRAPNLSLTTSSGPCTLHSHGVGLRVQGLGFRVQGGFPAPVGLGKEGGVLG